MDFNIGLTAYVKAVIWTPRNFSVSVIMQEITFASNINYFKIPRTNANGY